LAAFGEELEKELEVVPGEGASALHVKYGKELLLELGQQVLPCEEGVQPVPCLGLLAPGVHL